MSCAGMQQILIELLYDQLYLNMTALSTGAARFLSDPETHKLVEETTNG